jgi:hypothetical protein
VVGVYVEVTGRSDPAAAQRKKERSPKMYSQFNCVALAGAVCLFSGLAATADEVQVGALKDNTLYESDAGGFSNGSGDHFFAGVTFQLAARRGVIAFDIAGAIPAGATIESVELQLSMSQTNAGDEQVTLHNVLQDWGEGASDAPGGEGGGGQPMTGDVTWLHTFFNDQFWTTPGGDFDAAADGETTVGSLPGFYTWSSKGMVARVQAWLDDPSSNFGWLVQCNEDSFPTAKRFDSKDNPESAVHPLLTVQYSLAECAEGDVNCDGVVNVEDLVAVILDWGPCPGGNDCPADQNGDGVVDVEDLVTVILGWG